ncbi:hypothetical protein PM082_017167 [Marasmius tenuissimus]|nr:hypothetical protein PM082_017167 [Marasmius tenuissimus]
MGQGVSRLPKYEPKSKVLSNICNLGLMNKEAGLGSFPFGFPTILFLAKKPYATLCTPIVNEMSMGNESFVCTEA